MDFEKIEIIVSKLECQVDDLQKSLEEFHKFTNDNFIEINELDPNLPEKVKMEKRLEKLNEKLEQLMY